MSSKTTSTGIENVKKRLELLYPEKHQLKIKEDETGFSVILKIEI
jgi:LytS/YehU family sensor histidine kinase